MRAMLARGEIDEALMEVSFIDDPIWYAGTYFGFKPFCT